MYNSACDLGLYSFWHDYLILHIILNMHIQVVSESLDQTRTICWGIWDNEKRSYECTSTYDLWISYKEMCFW